MQEQNKTRQGMDEEAESESTKSGSQTETWNKGNPSQTGQGSSDYGKGSNQGSTQSGGSMGQGSSDYGKGSNQGSTQSGGSMGQGSSDYGKGSNQGSTQSGDTSSDDLEGESSTPREGAQTTRR